MASTSSNASDTSQAASVQGEGELQKDLPTVLSPEFSQNVNIDGNKVRATCVLCRQEVRGSMNPISNFTTHLKVSIV